MCNLFFLYLNSLFHYIIFHVANNKQLLDKAEHDYQELSRPRSMLSALTPLPFWKSLTKDLVVTNLLKKHLISNTTHFLAVL